MLKEPDKLGGPNPAPTCSEYILYDGNCDVRISATCPFQAHLMCFKLTSWALFFAFLRRFFEESILFAA